ncbi:hypothetical protein [Paenibacillus sp. NEAU-GSW1]|uniref:hypothetical protein n=1 Tax=Paenibacillus sp. NEAU-GSW1 TaxID=2682486 RepID=UPI0015652AA5|nr:hypothetical protein [Paenibacillus sp. NEAU-GSW1]
MRAEVVQADFNKTDAILSLLKGTHEKRERLQQVEVELTRMLIQAAAQAPYIFISTNLFAKRACCIKRGQATWDRNHNRKAGKHDWQKRSSLFLFFFLQSALAQ